MTLKIGIVGAAGTGKSSLARAVSKELGIPCLESKAITQDILERDGYDYASGIQVERFLANTGRQNEILRRTMEQEDDAESFVTDRTVVDLAAYVVCEMHGSDSATVRNVVETCRRRVTEYTHLFVCPWEDRPVDPNQKRTLNPWYQFLIHTIEIGLISSWRMGVSGCILNAPDIEGKMSRIREALKEDA